MALSSCRVATCGAVATVSKPLHIPQAITLSRLTHVRCLQTQQRIDRSHCWVKYVSCKAVPENDEEGGSNQEELLRLRAEVQTLRQRITFLEAAAADPAGQPPQSTSVEHQEGELTQSEARAFDADGSPQLQGSAATAEDPPAVPQDLSEDIEWPSPTEEPPFWERSARRSALQLGDAIPEPEKTATPLTIAHITAEMAPIAKVGGLGDVVTGLSRACLLRGHSVVVLLPFYSCLPQQRIDGLTHERDFGVPKGSRRDGGILVHSFETSAFSGAIDGVPVVLLRPTDSAHSNLFVGNKIYGGSYDEKEAYLYFCRAALEYLATSERDPHVIHLHEWQAAASAMLFWDLYSSAMPSARLAMTLHNMDSTGECSQEEFAFTGVAGSNFATVDRALDERTIGHNPERLSLLQGGIVYSNQVTTVSPTYAADALGGGGGALRSVLGRADVRTKFQGILNGIDTKEWDPSKDDTLPAPFSADEPAGKALCKQYLQEGLGLAVNEAVPLVVCVTRLVPQKGVHLIRHALFHTREHNGQAVLLGSGHSDKEFQDLAAGEFRDDTSVRILIIYSDTLAHLMYAAADIVLVPSMFEPCGLTQLIAMRYGAVPVVRATGGLADTVLDVDAADSGPNEQPPNGYTFTGAQDSDVADALERAFSLYRDDQNEWQRLSCSNMRAEVGWDMAAVRYLALYNQMLD